MCQHVCRHVNRHVCRHVCRHVHRNVCRNVCKHMPARTCQSGVCSAATSAVHRRTPLIICVVRSCGDPETAGTSCKTMRPFRSLASSVVELLNILRLDCIIRVCSVSKAKNGHHGYTRPEDCYPKNGKKSATLLHPSNLFRQINLLPQLVLLPKLMAHIIKRSFDNHTVVK